jgi:hypothetical protein
MYSHVFDWLHRNLGALLMIDASLNQVIPSSRKAISISSAQTPCFPNMDGI